jgi:hypothetical protein
MERRMDRRGLAGQGCRVRRALLIARRDATIPSFDDADSIRSCTTAQAGA